jgi:hypothetical protein
VASARTGYNASNLKRIHLADPDDETREAPMPDSAANQWKRMAETLLWPRSKENSGTSAKRRKRSA